MTTLLVENKTVGSILKKRWIDSPTVGTFFFPFISIFFQSPKPKLDSSRTRNYWHLGSFEKKKFSVGAAPGGSKSSKVLSRPFVVGQTLRNLDQWSTPFYLGASNYMGNERKKYVKLKK